MDWGFWIVPVIMIAVFILRTVLGKQEARPPGPVAGGARPAPRRGEPATSLDEFLRRVREAKQAEEQGEPVRRSPPRGERADRPGRPRPVQARPRRQPVEIVEEEIPVAVAVEPAPAVRPAAVVVTPPVLKPVPVAPAVVSAAVPVAAPVERPAPRSVQDLMKLLRSAEGMRQAVLMKEILGPPVARRPR